jgi:hypothetical protein
LEVYRKAAGQCDASFVVLDVGRMGSKLVKIRTTQSTITNSGRSAPEIEVINAKKKPSASKR